MTTRQTPDAVREAVRREIRNAWFDGRSAARQYDSKAVEAKWDRQVARILAALDSRAGDAGKVAEQAHAAVRYGDHRMGYLKMCEAYGMLTALSHGEGRK